MFLPLEVATCWWHLVQLVVRLVMRLFGHSLGGTVKELHTLKAGAGFNTRIGSCVKGTACRMCVETSYLLQYYCM